MANQPSESLQELRETHVALQSMEITSDLASLVAQDAITRAYWRTGAVSEEEVVAHAQRIADCRYRMVEAAEAIALEDAQAPFEKQPQDRKAAARLAKVMEYAQAILTKLKQAALSGELPVFMPSAKIRHVYGNDVYVRDFREEAYADDLDAWLEKHEPRCSFRFRSASGSVGSGVEAQDASTHNPKPLGRQIWQEQEILRVINELGYTATSLPKPNNKRWVKAEVREKLSGSEWQGTVFDAAWKRLRASGNIASA